MLIPASSLRCNEGTTERRNTETKSETALNSLQKNPYTVGLFSKAQILRWHEKWQGLLSPVWSNSGDEEGKAKLRGASEAGGGAGCEELGRGKYSSRATRLLQTKATERYLTIKSCYILWFSGTDPQNLTAHRM